MSLTLPLVSSFAIFSSVVLLLKKTPGTKLKLSGTPKKQVRKAIKTADDVLDNTARHAETKFEYIALAAFQGTIYLAMLAFWRDLIWNPSVELQMRIAYALIDAGVMITGTVLSRWFLNGKDERIAFKREHELNARSMADAIRAGRKPLDQEILEASRVLEAVRKVFKDIPLPPPTVEGSCEL